MRIKRQRRKLRGKYSGNCLSCAAKWSKCWYIASMENQAEWESRLNKPVTPTDDEVCFQCWDAKIRTSPKRKLNYKAELPMVEIITPLDPTHGGYPLRPSKRVDRNKRRALNEDYAYDIDADLYDSKGSSEGSSEGSEEDEYFVDENDEHAPSLCNESIVFDEENAVMLLSTAFHSIPRDIIDEIASGDDADGDDEDDVAKNLGAYYYGRRGKDKKRRVCDVPSPNSDHTPSPSSPGSPPSLIPQHPDSPTTTTTMPVFPSQSHVGIISALLAQPVVS